MTGRPDQWKLAGRKAAAPLPPPLAPLRARPLAAARGPAVGGAMPARGGGGNAERVPGGAADPAPGQAWDTVGVLTAAFTPPAVLKAPFLSPCDLCVGRALTVSWKLPIGEVWGIALTIWLIPEPQLQQWPCKARYVHVDDVCTIVLHTFARAGSCLLISK